MHPAGRVSVVIPFHNGLGDLRKCLQALAGQTYPAEAVEVIAVDNGSSEPTGAIQAEFSRVRWLEEPRAGSYLARNRGVQQAQGEFIAFTDADCVPAPGWLAAGIAALETTTATVVGGRIDYLNPDGRGLNACERFEEEFFLLTRQQHLIERVGVAATANVLTRRDVFDRVGLFDADLKSLGDGEWIQRATGKGEILGYADAAVVSHPRRSTLGPVFRKVRRIAGGRTLLLKKQGASGRKLLSDIYRYSVFNPRIQRYAVAFPNLRGLGLRLRMFLLIEFLSLANSAEKIRVLLGAGSYRG
jgi:glycosyltransferase involved in cell wall biosynthesis